ncbi:MAG: glycosyltransferase, partial [Nanoarchaeota archaeon]
MEKSTICFVYKNKCHPVTQTYADAIEAVPIKITGPFNAFWKALVTPNYDYYFVETAMSLFLPIIKRSLGNQGHIIFRANDGLFGETETEAYLATKKPIKRRVLLYLIKNIDGVSVESALQIEEVEKITNVPVEVCESYVENKEYLENITPDLNTNTFLFIGAYRPPYDHKNIELLIEIFNDLPDYHLIIIGKDTEKLKSRAKENIEIKGFVEDKDEYYKKATYYIHLPKYEAGPITLLEAITAGLIPITNNNAGHHTIVKRVNQKLIINADATAEEAAK